VGVFDLFKKKAEPAEDVARKAAPEQPAPMAAGDEEAAPSLFGRLRTALKKTTDFLNTDIRDLFKREGRLVDDEFLSELYAILVKTDMGTGPAARIRDRIGRDFRARVVHMGDVLRSVQDEVQAILKQPEQPIRFAASGPTVILVVGVNGSGKTTSIAKLMRLFRDRGKKVVVGAGDTFRAAAAEQLTIWAQREGAEIVRGENQGDPAAVAHKAVALAIQTGADVCIIDTAGRLQTQSNLMQQLEKIYRVITRQIPDAPHEVLLVLDATAGQNAISQAQGFSTAAKCTGIILAKLDGTAKGGVIIPIREKFAIPVKFVGIGEKASDLAVFDADQFAAALFEGAA
jgi:fused signal recognition particle receptor